ncbi:MAG: phosphate starvation-inducible protein PsiE [Candidatus Parcubacteria bacterium]|nr:MAG: phosphate starvation-inducible protein PsiE [Candidatus Parcubacteria bacterium]
MEKLLQQFPQQFLWDPRREEGWRTASAQRVLVCGMGGSHLAADLLAAQFAARGDTREVRVHSSYGIPPWAGHFDLIILSSYSGETEETLDAWHAAYRSGLPVAVVASGGTLLDLAQKAEAPFIKLPHPPGMQPRLALGWSARAIAALAGWEDVLEDLRLAGKALEHMDAAKAAQQVASLITGRFAAVYAAHPYGAAAHLWKIFLNETGKTFAWDAEIPEMNHNDIEGFDAPREAWAIPPQNIAALFLVPQKGIDERIARRVELTRALIEERGVSTHRIDAQDVGSAGLWGVVFVGAWVGFLAARARGVEPLDVNIISLLKQALREEE